MHITQHLVIHGRVQGVGFRDSLCREAARLGVTGWVRNRFDGTVEAMVYGERAATDAIVQWCRRGPPAARVVRVELMEADGEFESFQFLPTA
jgi:acylphosphatase